MRAHAWLLLGIGIVFLQADLSVIATDVDPGAAYRAASIEAQMLIAELKLREHEDSTEDVKSEATEELLAQARDYLRNALRLHNYYQTGNEAYAPGSEAARIDAVADSDGLDYSESPLSAIAHLHLAREKAMQLSTQTMVADRQYSESEIRQIEALDEAEEAMRQAMEAAESALGRAGHWNSEFRFYFEASLDFKPTGRYSRSRPIHLVRADEDGEPRETAFVRILDAEYEISPDLFVRSRLDQLREEHSDLEAAPRRPAKGDSYEFTARYSYSYHWEGASIKADVHLHKRGEKAMELSYIAYQPYYSPDRSERILQSFFW